MRDRSKPYVNARIERRKAAIAKARAAIDSYVKAHDLMAIPDGGDLVFYAEETRQQFIGQWKAALGNTDAPAGFQAFAEQQIRRWGA